MKRLLSFLMAVVLLIALVPCCFADNAGDGGEAQMITTAPELYNFCFNACSGAIAIAKATLYRSDVPEDVYLIHFSATGDFSQRLNNPLTSFICGCSLSTEYLRTALRFAKDTIPYGSKVILVGHSLGGMIAQQFMADPDMRSRFKILNALAFGAPCVLTGVKEGSLHRLVDSSDIIPYLTPLPMRNLLYCISRENGGLFLLFDQAHHCYGDVKEWGRYDCFGVKGGSVAVSCCASDFVCIS